MTCRYSVAANMAKLAYVPVVGAASNFPEHKVYRAHDSIMLYVTIAGKWRMLYFVPGMGSSNNLEYAANIPDEATIVYDPGCHYYFWKLPNQDEPDPENKVFPVPSFQEGEWILAPLYNELVFYKVNVEAIISVPVDLHARGKLNKDHLDLVTASAVQSGVKILLDPANQEMSDGSVIVGRKVEVFATGFDAGSMVVDTAIVDITKRGEDED